MRTSCVTPFKYNDPHKLAVGQELAGDNSQYGALWFPQEDVKGLGPCGQNGSRREHIWWGLQGAWGGRAAISGALKPSLESRIKCCGEGGKKQDPCTVDWAHPNLLGRQAERSRHHPWPGKYCQMSEHKFGLKDLLYKR